MSRESADLMLACATLASVFGASAAWMIALVSAGVAAGIGITILAVGLVRRRLLNREFVSAVADAVIEKARKNRSK